MDNCLNNMTNLLPADLLDDDSPMWADIPRQPMGPFTFYMTSPISISSTNNWILAWWDVSKSVRYVQQKLLSISRVVATILDIFLVVYARNHKVTASFEKCRKFWDAALKLRDQTPLQLQMKLDLDERVKAAMGFYLDPLLGERV